MLTTLFQSLSNSFRKALGRMPDPSGFSPPYGQELYVFLHESSIVAGRSEVSQALGVG